MGRALRLGLVATLALLVNAVPTRAQATPPGKPDERKAEVPALADFHEVICPLWHVAWPGKDVAKLLE